MSFEAVFLDVYWMVNIFWWIDFLRKCLFISGNSLKALLFLVLGFIKVIAYMNCVFPFLYFQLINILCLKYIFFGTVLHLVFILTSLYHLLEYVVYLCIMLLLTWLNLPLFYSLHFILFSFAIWFFFLLFFPSFGVNYFLVFHFNFL